MTDEMTSCEYVILAKREVFVYKIPPLTSKGYKANDWNLGEPRWTGRLRLFSVGDKLEIRLEENSGELYAVAPISSLISSDFEPVSDSSRYFVIRLRNNNGQTALVGIGFSDRGDSFDLNVAIRDFFKTLEKTKDSEASDAMPSVEGPDLSLRDGQTITVNFGGRSNQNSPKVRQVQDSAGPVPLLPPPPSAGNRIRKSYRNQSDQVNDQTQRP